MLFVFGDTYWVVGIPKVELRFYAFAFWFVVVGFVLGYFYILSTVLIDFSLGWDFERCL